jgi:4-methyl-5(b-hydroxyethyl)-thiazole monophosphate biosynthesis
MARVLVPIAEGCEELEAVTIIDLLRRAGIEVITASLEPGPVTCSRKTVIVPDTTLESIIEENFDMIVLPGGLPGADNLNSDPRIHSLLKTTAANQGYTAAICAAPKVLASAGLLDGKTATSYPGALNSASLPQVLISEQAIEKDGYVITSRGPGTAMDFALELIETLEGPERRQAVEQSLLR